jgi:hypothetical protein
MRDAYWHMDYKIDALGILSPLFIPFRQVNAEKLTFICYRTNKNLKTKDYFRGTIINLTETNYYYVTKWIMAYLQ